MIINSKDMEIYKATLIDRQIDNHEIINVNDWLEGASSPVFHREYSKYKDIALVFVLVGDSEQEIRSNISKMVEEFKVATIKFKDIDYFYDTHLEGFIEVDKLANRAYKVSIDTKAHKTYLPKETVSYEGRDNIEINVEGELETPVSLFIEPQKNIPTFTIDGLSDKPIVLKNLQLGHTYTIDGHTMRYLEDGANNIKDYMGFKFPKAKAGINPIQFSDAVDVVIEWYPRFN